MTKNSIVALMALLAVALVLMAGPGQAAVDCNRARSDLVACVPYLTGAQPSPTTKCCDGVQYVKDNAVTRADKQAACQCIKDTASHLPGLQDSAAQQLGPKCKIVIDVPISKTVDCSSI